MNNNLQSSRWKHPHGFDILKKLGIVERSANSLSEGDEEYDKPVKFKKKGDIRRSTDESDEEVVFDRDSLLKNGSKKLLLRHGRSMDCSKSLHCQTLLLSVAFFIVGLCLAIVGPTLPDLQLHTKSQTFSSTVSVVSANALGIILGISCAATCYKLLNALCVITFALWLCALTTLIIPWCSSLTAAAFIFVAQGLSLGFVLKGIYTLFYAYWKRKYNVFLCFYVALAFGATMSPLVTSSFVANQLKHSQITTLSVSQSSPPLMVKRDAVLFESNNTTFNDESLSNGTINCNDSDNNCTNLTSTESFTTTPKNKKPHVYDATDIDPPRLRGDSNLKEVLLPAKPMPAVKSTTTMAPTLPVSITQNLTTETNASVFVSMNTTTLTTSFGSSTEPTSVQPEELSTSTKLTDETVSDNWMTTDFPTSSSMINENTVTSTVVPNVDNNVVSFGNSDMIENASQMEENETSNGTRLPQLLSIYETVTNSTINDEIKTTKTFAIKDVPRNVWDYMLQRVTELNNVRVAYLVISVISFVSTTLYIFMCCCSSCRSLKPTFAMNSEDTDEKRFQLKQLCTNRINLYASMISWLFCFLSGGVESVMSNLLTVYCVTGMWQEQSSGVLLTTTYWFFVSLGRMAALGLYKKLWQTNWLAVCLACSFISCGIMVVFSKSWIVLCVCVAAIGLTTGHLTPMIFCWLDQQLGLESWFITAWLCSDQIGRAILAPLTAYGMLNHSPHMMPIVVLICTVFLSVVTVVMRKIVLQASQMNVADLVVVTRHIKSSDGKKLLEYHRHVDEIDGSESD